MKIPAKSLTRLIIYIVAGISIASLLIPQPSWAQSAPSDRVEPLQDFNPQQNQDPFARGAEQDSFGGGIFDLIHRAQMGNIRSINEYSSEQNQSINDAAAQFRARQRQMMLQNQQQVNPVNPVITTPQQSN